MAVAQPQNQQNRRPQRRNDRVNANGAPREEKQFEEIVISIDRVARVVKGGDRKSVV